MAAAHLDLRDAFLDSPQYRANLVSAHKEAEAFESILNIWAEKAKIFVQAVAGLNEATDTILRQVTSPHNAPPFLDSHNFEHTRAELQETFFSMESSFVSNLESDIIEPLLQFQGSVSQMLSEARRGFLNSAEDYESIVYKYSSLPHLKNQKNDEFTNYLYNMKLESCKNSLKYANMLNELPLIRESLVLKKMNLFLDILSTWFDGHQLSIDKAKPVINEVLESIDKEGVAQDIQSLQVDEHTLLEPIEGHLTKYKQALGLLAYDEVSIATQISDLSVDSELMMNQGKSGYLLLRKANSRGGWTRHWFRIQMPEGLFIQCTNSVDQSIVVDLHASLVRETDCDGRSYTFEISTPPILKYYFQAETDADMMEWVTALRVPHIRSINYHRNDLDVPSAGSVLVKSGSVYIRELKSSKNPHSIKDPLSVAANWRRIVLIIRTNGTLYQFDEHDKTVIETIKIKDLQRNQINLIDESALKKKNCFILRSRQRIHFFMTEGLSERNEWVSILKTFAQPEVLGYSEPPHFCYRLDRTYWISVIEGRGFGQADPYCYIELDGERKGKTSTKSKASNPIWVEDFLFTDLPALRSGVDVVVMNKNRLHKDSNIGKVRLPITYIQRDEMFEGWYPMMYESKISGYPAEMVGELRLRFKYEEVVVLPSSSYDNLLKLLLDVDSRLIFDLVNVSKNLEWFAENMMRIYAANGMAMEWLLFLARNEVELTDDSNILFRGNSILTKAIDGYMKLIGLQYVDEAIGDIVRSICENKIYVEVDELKLDRCEDIRAHWRVLVSYTKLLWKSIEKTQAKCPSELRVFFSELRGIILDKYPEQNQSVRYTCISGFIFLRLFCPALLNPKQFQLVKEQPDARTRRTLTLLAKATQSLANLTDFNSKESYMAQMNEFVRENSVKLRDYIDYIATEQISNTSHHRIQNLQPPETFFKPPQVPYLIDVDKELSSFSSYVMRHREDLENLIIEEKTSCSSKLLKRLLFNCNVLEEKTRLVMEGRSGHLASSISSLSDSSSQQTLSSYPSHSSFHSVSIV